VTADSGIVDFMGTFLYFLFMFIATSMRQKCRRPLSGMKLRRDPNLRYGV
jgi:hypothetical protein